MAAESEVASSPSLSHADRDKGFHSRVVNTIRLVRPHQWLKNGLLVLPLVFSHQVGDSSKIVSVVLAIAAFSLAASAIYVINDRLDIHADRTHPTKRQRPFASGALPQSWAIPLMAALFVGAVALCLALPGSFALVLASYTVLAISYSAYFKARLLVDVVLLAALYTIRIIAGGAATQIVVSPWLFALSMFLFLSLAFAKRFAELKLALLDSRDRAQGRGYVVEDLQIISAVGPASGYMAVLVLALYVNDETSRQLYRVPALLWLTCPLLLYWITRVWFLANRGTLRDDPLMFALGDPKSWLVLLLCLALGIAATVIE